LTVVGLVGVNLAQPGAPTARRRTDRRDVVEDRLEHDGVVDVGGGDRRGVRVAAAPVSDHRALVVDLDLILSGRVSSRSARSLLVVLPHPSWDAREALQATGSR
jgi:hypothetical protein